MRRSQSLSKAHSPFREQAEKNAAKERYAKMHAAGKVRTPHSQRRLMISRPTRRAQIWGDSPRFARSESSLPPSAWPRLPVRQQSCADRMLTIP